MIALIHKLYRMLFCRGGHGVHSPFVFDLITTVIEEQHPYYCYDRLYPVRLQLMQCPNYKMKRILDNYCFTEDENRLLFRLANRFKPETIFVIGSAFGLTPLYVTAFSKDTSCVVVEPDTSIAAIADEYLKKFALASVVVRDSLTDVPERLDFIVWDVSFISFYRENHIFSMQGFERFLDYVHDDSVMVISGINSSRENRKVWKGICAHPGVTVTVDFYRFGVVFFNSKLYRKTYKNVVLCT